jgi:hypothetical protein
MRLADIRDDYRAVLRDIEATADDGGMIDAALMDRLDSIVAARDDKLFAIAGMIKELSAERNAADHERERLARQVRSAEKSIDYLKSICKAAMEEAGIETFARGSRRLRIQQNSQPALVVTDPLLVPHDHWREVRQIDSIGLRAALEAGVPVPGAELRKGDHLRVT